jgi:hypothetical protein
MAEPVEYYRSKICRMQRHVVAATCLIKAWSGLERRSERVAAKFPVQQVLQGRKCRPSVFSSLELLIALALVGSSA